MKFWKLMLVGLLSLILVNCSDDDDGGGGDGDSDYYLSYKINESTCSTNRQILRAKNDTEMANQFCNAMLDQQRNNYCGEYQRKSLFDQQCPEMTWPHKSTPRTGTIIKVDYSFTNTSCGTGWHIFVAENERTVMRDLCVKILDDTFNRNCAKSERTDHYFKMNCPEYLRESLTNY